jgi:MFS family permease
VLYSAGAIGGFVAAPLLNRLIESAGTWRAGWWLLALLSALAACLAMVFVRKRPEDVGQVAHGVVHLQDLGHTAGVGAWAVGIMTVSGLIGKVILAAFGDRIDPRYIYAAFVAVFGVGPVVVVNAHALWQVFLFATCIGIGFGGGIVCLMTVLSNYYGTLAFASLAGLAVAINTTPSAIAPKVAGRLFDQGVGYAVNFYFLAVWCFVGAVVLFCMRRPGVIAAGGTTLAQT